VLANAVGEKGKFKKALTRKEVIEIKGYMAEL
jgi:hypothetical protein